MAKDNTELKKAFLIYYAALPIKKLASQYIGRTLDTINDWEKADPKFSEDVERTAAEWAKNNAGKVRSKEWLLERVMQGHFKPPKAESELTGEINVNIKTYSLDGSDKPKSST